MTIRHARPCAGHPPSEILLTLKAWMARTSPAMTGQEFSGESQIHPRSSPNARRRRTAMPPPLPLRPEHPPKIFPPSPPKFPAFSPPPPPPPPPHSPPHPH